MQHPQDLILTPLFTKTGPAFHLTRASLFLRRIDLEESMAALTYPFPFKIKIIPGLNL